MYRDVLLFAPYTQHSGAVALSSNFLSLLIFLLMKKGQIWSKVIKIILLHFVGGGNLFKSKTQSWERANCNYSIHLSQSCSETYSEEITHSALQCELSKRRRRAHA